MSTEFQGFDSPRDTADDFNEFSKYCDIFHAFTASIGLLSAVGAISTWGIFCDVCDNLIRSLLCLPGVKF
jgi:hypothetical protein